MFNKSRAWAIGLLVAVGVAGFAAGAATTGYGGSKERSGRERASYSYSRLLAEELQLSPAQRDSVRAIMRRHRGDFRAVYDVIRPQLDSIRIRVRGEIEAVLTPEQRAAYERLRERDRERRSRRDSGEAGGRDER